VWRKNSDVARVRSYTSMPVIGYGMAAYSRPAIGQGEIASYNLVKTVADAFAAKITKEKPKVSFVTEEGSYKLQEQAKGLERFLEGQYYEAGVYELGPQVALDGGGIFGTGLLYPYIDGTGKDARVAVERVLPNEVLVDEKDGMYGFPTQILRERWIDRAVLEEMYKDEPEKLDKIRKAKQGTDSHTGAIGYDSTADQLLVTEAWHKKSGRKAKDGRYVRCIIECDLEDEDWTYDWLPFFRYMRSLPPFGWWGISIADDLAGVQMRINRTLMRMDKAYRLLGAAHVLCERSAKVNFSQWDNETGSKIEYTAPFKPEISVPTNLIPPEMYQQLDRDWSRGFEMTGVPQGFAQGEGSGLPAASSGKAQEMHLAITDQRMQVAIERYHLLFLELGRAWLDLSREIVKKHNPDFGAKAMDRNGAMRKVLLRENDLPEEEYRMKLWATNLLPDEPEARAAMIERFLNSGMIAPDAAKRLLGTLDPDEEQSLEEASYDAVEWCISNMLDEGKYIGPQPFFNLEQGKRQVNLALVRATRQGRPEPRLQMLRDWLVDAVNLPNLYPDMFPQPGMPQGMASAPGTPVAAAPAPGVTPAMMPPPGGGGPPPMPQAA